MSVLLPTHCVERPLLARRILDAIASCPVTLLLAPAGYGKSTMVSLVARQSPLPVTAVAVASLPEKRRWPAVRAMLSNAPREGLLVIDGIDAIPAIEEEARLDWLLACLGPRRLLITARSSAVLPLWKWQMHRQATVFRRPDLAASEEEWGQAYGTASDAAALQGWWALGAAAEGGPALQGEWLRKLYLPSLPEPQRHVLGISAAGWHGAEPARLAGLSPAEWEQASRQLQADDAPLCNGQPAPMLASLLREAWQASYPHAAQTLCRHGFEQAVAQQDHAAALHWASDSREPALAAALVQAFGWQLLLGAARERVGSVLDLAAGIQACAPEVSLLRAAWWIEVRRLPEHAERIIRAENLAGPIASILLARCKLMYDDAAGALQCAQSAWEHLRTERGPLRLYAQYALAQALLETACPVEALPLAQDLVAAARFQGLAALEADGLHALARIQQEAGLDRDLLLTLRQIASLLPALEDSVPRQSLARLLLTDADERLAPVPAVIAAPADGDFYALPWLIARARRALIENRLQDALSGQQQIRMRLHAAYASRKWQLEADFITIWIAGYQRDAQALAPWLLAPDLSPLCGLHAWRHAVLCAGAALLAQQPWPQERLDGLCRHLQSRGLGRMRHTAELIRLLSGTDAENDALHAWLKQATETGRWLDALWLAPACVAPLTGWLRRPDSVRDLAVHRAAQALQLNMQAPAAASAGDDVAKPDALSEREWKVLLLIARGLSNEQIAQLLHVSLSTVKSHINRIYAKLALRTRDEAVFFARQHIARCAAQTGSAALAQVPDQAAGCQST